jgi:hypothetical protein
MNISAESARQVVLMAHVSLGMLCLLGSVWICVDVLNANSSNLIRIRRMSVSVAVVMWLTIFLAGGWYIYQYAPDKKIILHGPWPAAHDLFMETKEHVVIVLWILATFLPIAARNDLAGNREARKLMLYASALTAVLALAADGMGGVIAMGVKMGLMPK